MWRNEPDPDVQATEVSLADWMEVILAHSQELRGGRQTAPLPDEGSLDDPAAWDELVVLLQVAWLKRARYRAYTQMN